MAAPKYTLADKIEDIKVLHEQGMRVMDAGARVGWGYNTLRDRLNQEGEPELLAELDREKEVDMDLGIDVR